VGPRCNSLVREGSKTVGGKGKVEREGKGRDKRKAPRLDLNLAL